MAPGINGPRVLILHQPNLPPVTYTSGQDFKHLAEHIYSLAYMAYLDADWDIRGITTYILDSDWLGLSPERLCACDVCAECNALRRWDDKAYELLNEIINNFEPPPSVVWQYGVEEVVPVTLLPPNALALPLRAASPTLPFMEGAECRPAYAPVP